MARKVCTVEGCENFVHGRGLCKMHHQRAAKHGSPLITITNRTPLAPGQRFGRLVVVEVLDARDGGNRAYRCRCDCGNRTDVRGSHLTGGRVQSCGCLAREVNAARMTTHGLSWRHPLYPTWMHMRERCNDPTNPDYGGRGIVVDPRWDDFAQFAADMGPKPGPDYSIDRIDNDGPYSSENCRWATAKEQANNRRLRRDSVLLRSA